MCMKVRESMRARTWRLASERIQAAADCLALSQALVVRHPWHLAAALVLPQQRASCTQAAARCPAKHAHHEACRVGAAWEVACEVVGEGHDLGGRRGVTATSQL